jgi:hypothetical protein
MVSSIGLFLAAVVSVIGLKLPLYSLFAFLGVGICVILAEAGLGMAVGSRFADFSEGPRPRFVTITGSIIGSILGMIAMVAMIVPVATALVLSFLRGVSVPLSLALTLSGLIGLLISWTGYKLSIGPVANILAELPN